MSEPMHVLWIDRKGFTSKGTLEYLQGQSRITRRFIVHTMDVRPFPVGLNLTDEEVTFEAVGTDMVDGVLHHVYREVA